MFTSEWNIVGFNQQMQTNFFLLQTYEQECKTITDSKCETVYENKCETK